MPQAPLDQDDLDTLTKMQNKLMRMRKREAAQRDDGRTTLMSDALTSTIKEIDEARSWLGSRLNVDIQSIGEQW